MCTIYILINIIAGYDYDDYYKRGYYDKQYYDYYYGNNYPGYYDEQGYYHADTSRLVIYIFLFISLYILMLHGMPYCFVCFDRFVRVFIFH